jgi:hypothetical protein
MAEGILSCGGFVTSYIDSNFSQVEVLRVNVSLLLQVLSLKNLMGSVY